MRKEEEHKIAINIIQFLFALILLSMICFSFVGCGTIKEIPINNIEKVVYKDSLIYITDTITIEIPKEVVKEIVPQDTVSQLNTSLASSVAKVEKGQLYHTLKQEGTVITKIDTVVITKNIEKIIEKEIPIEVVKEVKHIPNWAWISLIFNIIVIVFIAFKIYLRVKQVV